jgi:L-ascorbate metabolism protein UlaG (beta-lactamase superfamily)
MIAAEVDGGMTVDALTEYVTKRLRWYGRSAIRCTTETGPVLFVDPVGLPASAGRADLVLITHPHGDHCSRRSLSAIRGPGTVVLAPESAVRRELSWVEGAEGMKAGQGFRIEGAAIHCVPAYNLSKPFHAKENGWLGYLIEVDGLRIYHAGDTDLIPEMRDLHPDIALLPVGGFFGMDVPQAADAAAALRAGLAIPMHFGPLLGGRRAGERLRSILGDACMVLPVTSMRIPAHRP